ncbi:MAG TPA: hypothetical protein VF138_01170 [Caulobacteraceae bacterium]
MFKVKDPRTGEDALIADHVGYREDMAAARSPACTHSRTDLRRWTNANGAVVIQAQCLSCGERQGNQRKVPERNAYPEADLSLREEWLARDRRAIDAVRIRHIDMTGQNLDAQADAYESHIASEAWRQKRVKVLKRCGGLCEGCGDASAVEVHHLTYEHLGDELLFELVGLCVTCHTKVHHGWHERTTPEPSGEDSESVF